MNMNEEDFTNSDAWLSEQLFAQLKDFNTDYKERNNASVMIDDSFQNYSINSQNNTNGIEEEKQTENRKQHFEPFDTFFKKNKNNKNENQYDMNSDVSGLSNTSNRAPVVDSIIDFTTTLPLVSAPVVAEAAAVVSETVKQNISLNFDPNEEEMKLLKFLETQPKNTFLDPKMYMQSELPSTAYRIVKCANCNCLFDIISFQSHVCDYDEQQNLLVPAIATPSSSSSFSKPVKDETLLPSEPACIRLLRENQIRIRRFLKDELKYDVNAVGSNGSASSVHLSGSTSSSSSGFNASTNSTGSSNSSLNKKQDGPHDCTICERKFVHASGLLRHMEKHALDLIPGSNASGNSFANGNSLQSVNGLRLVIKCTLCGRIFFEPTAAFEHLCNHFPGSGIDEKEIDNSAEVPYETYVDDAMKLLKMEVKEFPLSARSYQNEKMLVYLKMTILSCILQCEFCDLVFSEVSYLFVHSACHLPERRFECFACDIHVKTSKEISTHWQAECVFMRENIKIHQAATQRYFVCNVCENKFQSLDQLHEHRYTSYHFFPRINKRLGVLQLPCEYCEALFENTQECVNHYEEKHYKKNKREKDASGTSHKTRQYLCDICGKSYTQSSHLWQHLRFHQAKAVLEAEHGARICLTIYTHCVQGVKSVKPFACKEPGCNRKFTIRPDLNDHIRKCHTGERPYQCLICGKRFLTGSVFYQHRLIHRGERRYECEECGKRFYRADALKNHQRIHTGEKPFGCLFCTKNFRQRGDRDKHIRARHAHLDANARLMMQMQKLQLEAAAAVAAAQVQVQQKTVTTANTLPMFNTIRNINDDENSLPIIYDSASLASDQNDVVMVGNVAFPKSMFEPIMPDIDEESAIKAMHQM